MFLDKQELRIHHKLNNTEGNKETKQEFSTEGK
jgi:hypothetical protein